MSHFTELYWAGIVRGVVHVCFRSLQRHRKTCPVPVATMNELLANGVGRHRRLTVFVAGGMIEDTYWLCEGDMPCKNLMPACLSDIAVLLPLQASLHASSNMGGPDAPEATPNF